MTQEFERYIKNKDDFSPTEKKARRESLKSFIEMGFPNKKLEDWKFTDFNQIISKNFKKLKINESIKKTNKVNLVKDFEHNYILLVNGFLNSYSFEFENSKKVKIQKYSQNLKKEIIAKNSLVKLNDALHDGGYFLEVSSDYKFKKPIIIYNHFEGNIKDNVINNKNLILLNDNTDLNLLEYNTDTSKSNYIQNNFTDIILGKDSSFKNYTVQGNKSKGFFYKFIKGTLNKNSNYEDYIFSSGLKFNKTEEEIDINGEEGNCKIQSGLFLDKDDHQEIKTKINHLKPNSKSFQKVKNVLNDNCKSAYQGKILVKDIAQKTDAYQLSKALLIKDSSEFNAKPELEIYADDVKCSHGSTSGSINEDSIYYLMTRGIPRKIAISLLSKAFLFEISDSIKNVEIKKFIEKNLNKQIYGY
tara:strand:+ start:296 stop:1540 length:1245 start_codon:yes stop_codon:yes gene_type:complete